MMSIRDVSRSLIKRYTHAAFLMFIALVALRSAGCDYRVIAPATGGNGSGNGGGSGSGLNITITPSSASIQTNASVSLSAKVTGWTSDSTVTWSILSNGTGTLTPSGNSADYKAPATILISPTLVTVRATSKQDTSRHADAVITITKQTDTSHSIALSISPITVTIKAGETQQFSSIVTGTTNTVVLWMMTSGPGSITATGLYTAPASLTARSIAVVRAIPLADTSAWKEATITINISDTTPCFTRDIQPIIISNCTMSGCHDGHSGEARDLTTYSGVMSYVRAGQGSSSRIYTSITRIGGEEQMPPPPRQRLSAAQITLIKRWIDDGAKNTACPTDSSNCDTTAVSYAGFIAPTIQNYCLGCHSGANPSGGIDLSTYGGVQTVATNGQLVGGITGTAPYTLMPQSGSPLDACTIAKIRAWVTQGAKNN